jgi:hypothetical protein
LFGKTKIRDLDVAFDIKKEILGLPQIHKTKGLIHFIIMATVFLFYDLKEKEFFGDKLCFFSANLTKISILEIKIPQISNVTKLKKKKKKTNRDLVFE